MSDGMTEEAWEEANALEKLNEEWNEKRMDTIGQNGNVGYSIDDVTPDEWNKLTWGLSASQLDNKLRAKVRAARGAIKSDGSTASYYELPNNSSELQDLISHKDMNAQIGEIFRECYRYGEAEHCDKLRGIKKILFYANAELKRLNLNQA